MQREGSLALFRVLCRHVQPIGGETAENGIGERGRAACRHHRSGRGGPIAACVIENILGMLRLQMSEQIAERFARLENRSCAAVIASGQTGNRTQFQVILDSGKTFHQGMIEALPRRLRGFASSFAGHADMQQNG